MLPKGLFTQSFKLVKYNLVLVQPLLLYILIQGILSGSIIGLHGFTPASIIMMVSIVALFCAFLAGWFYMFHKSIDYATKTDKPDEEKAFESVDLFKDFLIGIGIFFGKFLLCGFIFITILIGIFMLIGFIGQHYIGLPQSVTPEQIKAVLGSETQAMALLNKLSAADKIIIAKWNFLSMSFLALVSFLFMFWAPSIIACKRNPFHALWESVVTVAKHPIASFSIFITFWISFLFVGIINSIGASNIIFEFFGLMFFVLLLVYYIMMIFLYFEKYRENTCINWSDSFK